MVGRVQGRIRRERGQDDAKCSRPVEVREDVGGQEGDSHPALLREVFEIRKSAREMRRHQQDVGGIEIDGEGLDAAGDRLHRETGVLRGMAQAHSHEGAGRTRAADHEDPHRSVPPSVPLL